MWDWLLPAAGAAVGLIGGSSKQEQQTTGALDPRLAKFVYGDESTGQTGVITDANQLYKSQIEQGGLNDVQRAGMNRTLQLYDSPFMTSGTDAMTALINKYLGKSGLSQQITPYANRGLLATAGQGQGQQGLLVTNPALATTAAPSAASQPQAIASTIQPASPSQMHGGSQNGNTSSIGKGSAPLSLPSVSLPSFLSMEGDTPAQQATASPTEQAPANAVTSGNFSSAEAGGGQGVNQTAINLGLKALAASKNPFARLLSPTIAALLGVGGTIAVDRQISALADAGAKLAENQGPSGMGTVVDADGNVRTYSSPATLAAQDAASFDSFGNAGLTYGGYGQQGRFSGGGNLSGMGGAQGIGGTANTGGYGFSGLGGLGMSQGGGTGLKGSW